MRTVAIVLAILVCTSFAYDVRKLSNAQVQKIENLRKDRKWSSIILNLAELHMMSKGPVDELASAIQDLLTDLGNGIQAAQEEFEARTYYHEQETKRLNDAIGDANSDISNTQEFLENVLYVNREDLEQDILDLQGDIQNAKDRIADATNVREIEHREYEQRVEEHNDSIAAIDEAIGLLTTLLTDDEEASLIQVKKAKSSLQKVQSKLTKNVENSFIKALVQLSTSEFADKGAIRKVADLLNGVRGNIADSLEYEHSEEANAQEAFEDEVHSREADITAWTIEIKDKNDDLARTNIQITESEQFVLIRRSDLAEREQELEDEDAAFDRATKNYNDLDAELRSEQEAAQEALDVVANANFASYIGDRVDKAGSLGVIDTAHGNSVSVN